MYKLKNLLFGWDYVQWNNSADSGIARVFKTKDGRVVYWRYRNISVLDEIANQEQVYWLTCSPAKYFPIKLASPYL